MSENQKWVDRYVDITYTNSPDGASGWVSEVKEIEGEDYLIFDYGFAFPINSDSVIKEVSPPEGDPGKFNQT